MNIEKERERFEQYLKINSPRINRDRTGSGMGYISPEAQIMFYAWQAAKADKVDKIEAIKDHCDGWAGGKALFDDEAFSAEHHGFESVEDAYNSGLDDGAISTCRAIIDSLFKDVQFRSKADQMTKARAREILNPQNRSTLDGSVRLNNIEGFIDRNNLFQPTCIDGYGDYTAEQLKALVWWLENKA